MVRHALPYAIPNVIKHVTFKQTADGAPANSYLDGELILDPSFFCLPIDTQRFIIAHEAGHIANQNSNEMQADQWGFNWYVQNGGSLKQLVASLADVLSFRSPEHLERTKAMLNRCLQYDLINNNNKMVTSISFNHQANSYFGEGLLNLVGQGIKNRQQRKMDKADVNNQIKLLNAQAGLGGGGSAPAPSGASDASGGAPSPNKSKTIIIVAVVVVVIGIAAFFLLRKK